MKLREKLCALCVKKPVLTQSAQSFHREPGVNFVF